MGSAPAPEPVKLPVKLIRFKLTKLDTTPVKFAFIKADVVPTMSYRRGETVQTVIADSIETRTNEYGGAEMLLYANDALSIKDSKYLITITYDSISYRFVVRIEEDMENVLDFEELLDREAMQRLLDCLNYKEGNVRLQGGKFFY